MGLKKKKKYFVEINKTVRKRERKSKGNKITIIIFFVSVCVPMNVFRHAGGTIVASERMREEWRRRWESTLSGP